MGTAGRLVAILAALIVAGVLFFVLRDDGDSDSAPDQVRTTAESAPPDAGRDGAGDQAQEPDEPKPKPEPPKVPTIVIEGGQPIGGVEELSYVVGERINFVVESDVTDHVHLHGYDVFMDIEAGGKVEFDVPAEIDGVFEVELEDSVVPIAEIRVEPE